MRANDKRAVLREAGLFHAVVNARQDHFRQKMLADLSMP